MKNQEGARLPAIPTQNLIKPHCPKRAANTYLERKKTTVALFILGGAVSMDRAQRKRPKGSKLHCEVKEKCSGSGWF